MNLEKIRKIFKFSPGTAIFTLNIALAALWGVSLAGQKIGMPFVTIVFGTLVLFAPGFCLALLIEQLSQGRAKPLFFGLWVVLLSILTTPAGVFAVSVLFLKQPPVNAVIIPFLYWWVICLTLVLFVYTLKRQPTILQNLSIDRITKKEIVLALIGFMGIMILNFVLYPWLPEVDGYFILIKWANIQTDPSLLASETRSLFLIFVNLCASLLRINPYWVLKAILPLLHMALVVSAYMFAREFVRDSRYRVMLALSPLFFPVVLQETLISRPQSFALISLTSSLAITAEILKNKQNMRKVYWLVVLVLLGIIGLKVHPIFVLIIIVGLISITIFFRDEIAKRPLDSLIFVIGTIALAYPWLVQTRFLRDFVHVIGLFFASFARKKFEFWFIDRYLNVDGIEVGWPGLSSIFYYGYNLGLVFPMILIGLVALRKLKSVKLLFKERYWGVIFLFVLFLFIAELGPRFQIAYLPDRAWLFLALVLGLALPAMIKALQKSTPLFTKYFFATSITSVLMGSGITYAKQGWVTTNEVEAAKFIKNQTPENALFLGQGSTKVMVRYYGNRSFAHPPANIFMDGEKKDLDSYLTKHETPYHETFEILAKRKIDISSKLTRVAEEITKTDLSDQKLEQSFETLNVIYQQKNSYLADKTLLRDFDTIADKPIYLLYNQNKFGSLYSHRSWWLKSNFYGANLAKLSENYPVVYEKNGIIIWEAKK